MHIFCTNHFSCAILSLSVLKKKLKKLEDAHCSDRSFCIHEFFFVRFLVFELLSIFYFAVVNSDLGLGRLVRKQRSLALQNKPLTITCSD